MLGVWQEFGWIYVEFRPFEDKLMVVELNNYAEAYSGGDIGLFYPNIVENQYKPDILFQDRGGNSSDIFQLQTVGGLLPTGYLNKIGTLLMPGKSTHQSATRTFGYKNESN